MYISPRNLGISRGQPKCTLYLRCPYFVFVLARRTMLKSIWRTTVYTKKGRVGKAEDQQEKKKKETPEKELTCVYAYNDAGYGRKGVQGMRGCGDAE